MKTKDKTKLNRLQKKWALGKASGNEILDCISLERKRNKERKTS